MGCGHAAVVVREVAHMQLVDHQIGGGLDAPGPGRGAPAGRCEGVAAEVGDMAARRVRGQARRVGIGDAVAHQSAAGHDDVDPVVVVAAAEVTGLAHMPGAAAAVELHRQALVGGPGTAAVQAQRDLAGRRCPQAEVGLPGRAGGCRDDRAQIECLGAGEEFIECARQLGLGCVHDAAARVFPNDATAVHAPARAIAWRRRRPGPAWRPLRHGRSGAPLRDAAQWMLAASATRPSAPRTGSPGVATIRACDEWYSANRPAAGACGQRR